MRFVIAPLAPLVAAVAVGIVADRWLLPFETKTWVMIALALGVIAIVTDRRTRSVTWPLLAAFSRSGPAGIIIAGRTWLPTTWPGASPKHPGRRGSGAW